MTMAVVSIGGSVGTLNIRVFTALLIGAAAKLRALEGGRGLHILLVGTGIYAVLWRHAEVLKKGRGCCDCYKEEHGAIALSSDPCGF
jgi:hypothetical protein